MGGKGDQQTQQQTQQSVSQPWAPAQPLLNKLLGEYGAINPAVTGAQKSALTDLSGAIGGIPNFGEEGAGAVSKLFGSSTSPQVGMLTDALAKLNLNLGGTASGAELDPNKTPGFSDALAKMMGDITTNIKGVYAGSGRAPSGAGSFGKSATNAQVGALAPVLQSQFNTNKQNQMGAAKSLFDASTGTAGAITGQNQVPLENAIKALGISPQLANLFTQVPQLRAQLAESEYGLPFGNLAKLLGPATSIAGLGGQTSGTSTGVVTQPQSTLSNIIGGASAGMGLLSFLSDERAKDDIEPVGKLDDGQTVYRYRYKGDPRTQIGLLAQEVFEHEPEAVTDMPHGWLGVDYSKATQRAAEMRKAA